MKKRTPRLLLIAGCCSLMLGGCSWLEDWPPGEKSAQAPYPEDVTIVKQDGGTWLAPGTEVTTISPGQGTVPADIAARLNALEAEVAILRNDMSMMAPALTRLTAMQNDISQILGTIQPAASNPASMANAAAREQVAAIYAPAGQPQPITPIQQGASVSSEKQPASVAAYQPMETAPPASAAFQPTASVKTIRMGEHDDKTRIVLDVTNDVPFKLDMDNQSRQLVVTLPGASWQAIQADVIGGNSVIAGFEAVPTGNGTQLALRLNQASEVIWSQILPAAGGKTPRIVIDLAK